MEELGRDPGVMAHLEHLRHQIRRHAAELVEVLNNTGTPAVVVPAERVDDVAGDRGECPGDGEELLRRGPGWRGREGLGGVWVPFSEIEVNFGGI